MAEAIRVSRTLWGRKGLPNFLGGGFRKSSVKSVIVDGGNQMSTYFGCMGIRSMDMRAPKRNHMRDKNGGGVSSVLCILHSLQVRLIDAQHKSLAGCHAVRTLLTDKTRERKRLVENGALSSSSRLPQAVAAHTPCVPGSENLLYDHERHSLKSDIAKANAYENTMGWKTAAASLLPSARQIQARVFKAVFPKKEGEDAFCLPLHQSAGGTGESNYEITDSRLS